MHRITSEHGVILTESNTMNPYGRKDAAHLKYHRRNRRLGRMSGQIRMRIWFRDCTGRWFDYLFVSPGEMAKIVHSTGWTNARVIRDSSSSYVRRLYRRALPR